jgi:hypothetical protein
MQRRVDVLRVCQMPILQGVATSPITFVRDPEVEDQALTTSLVSQVVVDLHVAAPALAVTPNCVRTLCPEDFCDPLQSCSLDAPGILLDSTKT